MLGQRYFRTEFYEEVRDFLHSIGSKAADKILWNIDLAEQTNDPRLFKKLTDEIWEFRTKYGNLQYRLLAFWDKTQPEETLVLATHGIIKKTDKMPSKEIEKAKEIRRIYFSQKKIQNGNKK
ncbi:MAG: type II toxin-antitoxin system RelE/ParE family toxin [Bacteroidetes bacterium]|nr:type II toxin-antitoxin system RelE/ParE family toxin [Bacteroidota bacterium]